MRIISAEDIRRAISMEEAIDAVALALKEVSAHRTVTPIRTALPVVPVGGTSLFMPAFVPAANGLGMKLVSVFPQNATQGKKTINGVVVLIDAQTAEPMALLEASYLTVLRTGAASGLAAKYLAREDASTLALIGTGAQAEGVLDAICTVRNIEEIRLHNRTLKKAEAFADMVRSRYPAARVIVCRNANDAVASADIVATTTNSSEPVFSAEALREGIHVNAVGSFRPDMQEIPTGLFKYGPKVVVESVEAALEETGDLLLPIREGLFSADRMYGELGELAAGQKDGRVRDEEVTLFKSVGLAAMDIVVGKIVYERAIQLGLGQDVSL